MIPDHQLLRNLAEDIPDMAESIREQLREIAAKIDTGLLIGQQRCRRCGEMSDVSIRIASLVARKEGIQDV
jgi:hypothetical protein